MGHFHVGHIEQGFHRWVGTADHNAHLVATSLLVMNNKYIPSSLLQFSLQSTLGRSTPLKISLHVSGAYLQDSQRLWLHISQDQHFLLSRFWQICPFLDSKCTGNQPNRLCVEARQFVGDTRRHWGRNKLTDIFISFSLLKSNFLPSYTSKTKEACVQRSAKRLVRGCEKFVTALAYLFCLTCSACPCLGPA